MPKIMIVCEQCGNKFSVFPYRRETARFCSSECRVKGIWNKETRRKLSKLLEGNKRHLGHHHSEETKKKLRKLRLKQTFSEEAKRKQIEALRKANQRRKKPRARCAGCGKELSRSVDKAKKLGIKYCRSCYDTKERRQKISQAKKGKPSPNKGRHLTWMMGERNPRWKGGVTPLTNKRLSSFEWRNIRQKVLERDNHTCRVCGNESANIIHHVIPYEISRNNSPSNLITVCSYCHPKLDNEWIHDG